MIEFGPWKPSDANYLATMTKADLVEFAERKMMPAWVVLATAKAVRKRRVRDLQTHR